jgi:molybdopterin/thiamine biosynthesis adenylyltransferase
MNCSVLDTAESSLVFWITAFAGMTNPRQAAGNETNRDSRMIQDTRTALEMKIQEKARSIKDLVGRDVRVLDENHADSLGRELGLSLLEIFKATLRLDIYPYRYLRNRESISLHDQLKLAESKVAVVGAGGLGGTVIQLLGRIGVGRLTVVDSDFFDETNLNRQAFCTADWVGQSKALAVQAQMRLINPAAEVIAHNIRLDSTNGAEILAGCHVIVDALDSVKDRLTLEALSKSLGVPFIHGALAGFEGQLLTVFPDDPGLKQIYGNGEQGGDAANRPEFLLGVPSITPSLVATLEAMEVLKILLNRGTPFRNKLVYIDLERGEWNRFGL